MEKYTLFDEIGGGGGAYGKVYKALDTVSTEDVAVQVISVELGVPSTVTREISALKEMHHPNIVRLRDVEHTENQMFLVFEYLHINFKEYMDSIPDFANNPLTIKGFLHQILRGVAYCHAHEVLHRDLKPQSLMIDKDTNTLKVANFGLVRALGVPVNTYKSEVDTPCYRAPEMLLGSPNYLSSGDVWSIGCIFAEMVNQKPLFRGESEINLSKHIFSILGTPDEDNWPVATSSPKPKFRRQHPKDLATFVPNLDPVGVNLLSKMICTDPIRRITARDALEHQYFKELMQQVCFPAQNS
ncbi:hypothetical protein Ddye_014186 [Dipteronia dyeriana]|uniref:cyclin-dependent kinase n=1 Tax=Dipteronia dyeriana TaxID=168575 RepID=A0AAD9X7K5_9ROSI|nr:hypothetical protein Ddye_014186 [Dipteronia dyeriana]